MDLLEISPDLFHATSFSLPGLWGGKLVATLHDANHLALPENYSPVHTLYYRLIVRPRAKRASALLTVSEFSRAGAGEVPGPDALPAPGHCSGRGRAVPACTRLAGQGLLQRRRTCPSATSRGRQSQGAQEPRALAKLAPRLPLPIVLLAGKGAARELGFPDTTVELTELPEAEMPLFYGAAQALLLPSRYEGFGLPALEAMAAGCPVIASNVSALPEVTGEAALLVPPDDLQAWEDAVLRLLRDDSLRRSLVEKGRERVSRFTWDDCARRTLAVYRRVLEKAR